MIVIYTYAEDGLFKERSKEFTCFEDIHTELEGIRILTGDHAAIATLLDEFGDEVALNV